MHTELSLYLVHVSGVEVIRIDGNLTINNPSVQRKLLDVTSGIVMRDVASTNSSAVDRSLTTSVASSSFKEHSSGALLPSSSRGCKVDKVWSLIKGVVIRQLS